MIWTVCNSQLRLNCLNLRLPLILMVAMAFSAVTTIMSCNHFGERLRGSDTVRAQHKLSPLYLHGDRLPNPLSVFCTGVSLKTPVSVRTPKMPYYGMETNVVEHPTDNILFAQVQYPDVSFTLAIVIGLGAMIFAYDSICGEKERGILKLAFSNNIPRHKFLLGKFMAGVLGLSAIVLVVWLLAVLLVTRESFVQIRASDFGLLTLACLTSLLYVFVLMAVAILISSLASSSRMALVCCVSFWLISCLLVPPFGPVVAKMVRRIPVYQQFVLSKHTLLKRETEEPIKAYKKKKVETQDQAAVLLMETLNKVGVKWSKLNEKLITEYQQRVAQQAELSRLICSVSPPITFQFALSELCGTSIAAQRDFVQQTQDWARAYAANIWEEYGSNAKTYFKVFELQVNQPDIKPFPIRSRLKHWFGYVAYMLILAIFCFAVTFVRFVRYDVR